MQVTRRLAHGPLPPLTCAITAAAGFALFWLAPTLAFSGAGLLVVRWGLALPYPTTISRVVAAWPHGLRTAYLIVPVPLPALTLRVAADGARQG